MMAPASPAGGRNRTRRGDVEIRPGARGPLGLLATGLFVTIVLALASEPRAAGLMGVPLAAGLLVWAAHALLARVRVVDDDVLHVRTLTCRAVVPLGQLGLPVLTRGQQGTRLHLRRGDGRHLATLSTTGWSAASLSQLADRLGAERLALSPGPVLEARYPGSLSWWGRHPLLTRVAARLAFIGSLSLAAFVLGEVLL